MSEEYIVQEEEGASRSPFLLAVLGLVGLLGLALLCTVGFALLRRNQTAQEIAAIEAANATIQAQNLQVTQTIVAMETIAAQSPTPSPTNTATRVPPTATATATLPKPSDTPVVRPPDGTATAAAEVNATGTSLFATAIFNATPTAIAGSGGGAGSGGATGGGTGGAGAGTGQLPQTGATSVWGVAGLALALIAIVVVARRLRAG
jgi:LPXTG-motif cell wall-anchored protein